MRLIDADKLKDELKTLPIMSNWGEAFIPSLIDAQPTAYDIDMIIRRLKELRETIYKSCGFESGAYVVACNAIEIVEDGRNERKRKEFYDIQEDKK